MSNVIDTLVVELKAETRKLTAGLNKVEQQLAKTKKSSGAATNALKGFGAIVATLGIGKLASQTVATIRTFEDLEATLRAVTGSADNAALSFDLIRKFTATTTFQVEEVADAFIRLKQAGVTPTSEVLQDFGNLAAGMGRSITQLSQAAFNATTGEMEMLKQFGVIAKLDGDKIRATFNGITTEIGRSGDEVIDFLRKIGREEFPTAIQERANTLTGAISNLQDSVSEFFVAIGEGGLKDALTELAKSFKQVLDDSRPMAKAIGEVLGGVFTLLGKIILAIIDNLNILVSALIGLASAQVVGAISVLIKMFGKANKVLKEFLKTGTIAMATLGGTKGLAKVLVGVGTGVAAFMLIEKALEDTKDSTEEAGDEFDELNKMLLDAMPQNKKAIDLVSTSTKRLAASLAALKTGKFSLFDIFQTTGADKEKFLKTIENDVFRVFQETKFSKTGKRGQQANFLKLFFTEGDTKKQIEDLRVELGLTKEQLYGPDGLFKDMGDMALQASTFFKNQRINIFQDLFKMDPKVFKETFAEIVDIPHLEGLFGHVQKVISDSVGSELDSINMLLDDPKALEAFVKAGQKMQLFGGRSTQEIKDILDAYQKTFEKEPEPFKPNERLADFASTLRGLFEDTKTPIQKVNEQLALIDEIFESADKKDLLEFYGLTEEQLALVRDNLVKVKEELKDTGKATDAMAIVLEQALDTFANNFVDALQDGENALRSFRNLVADMINQVIAEFMKMNIIKPMMNALFTAVGLPTLPVGKAGGGTIQGGMPTLVGERGAEIFVPNTGGTIMNNMNSKNALGGGTPVVINQSINFATGVVPTVRAEVMQMMPQIADATKAAVQESAMRGGNFRRSLVGG